MSNARLIGVGAAFAGFVLAGTLLGIMLNARTHADGWILGGLFGGLVLGGYAAVRTAFPRAR